MPAWLVTILIQFGVSLVRLYGLPFLKNNFPSLVPLLDEILKIINGASPSAPISVAAEKYHECSGVACPPHIKRD